MVLLSSLFFLSAVFWMRSAIHPVGWALAETLGAALLARLLLRGRPIRVPEKAFLLPLLLLAFWVAASLFWSEHLYATLMSLYKIFFWIFLAIVFSSEPEAWGEAIQKSVLIVGLAASILFLFFYTRTVRWMNYGNLYGGVLAQAAIVALHRTISSERKWRPALLVFLIASALILLGSLGPILGFLAGSGILLFGQPKTDRRRESMSWILAAAFCALAAGFLIPRSGKIFPVFPSIWGRRIQEPYAFERIQIWKDSLLYLRRYAWGGSGLGTIRDVYPEFKRIPGLRNASHAHNELLTLACELGIIPCLIFIFLLALVLSRLRVLWGPETRLWAACLAGCLLQSLFDFNLRYLPIAWMALYCLVSILPKRDLQPAPKRLRFALGLGLIVWAVILFLPGAASLVFLSHQSDPARRPRAARLAGTLDPLNGFFLSETGKMRDLECAIFLEPRNVWYRRRAARFYAEDWEITGSEASRRAAAGEYKTILRLAPNVPEFEAEFERLQAQIALPENPNKRH